MNWVLFEHGTCIMLMKPETDLSAQAIKILQENGKVVTGTSSADFEVTRIPEINGWTVTGDYPGIIVYISSDEGRNKKDFEIGLIGRNKRELDEKERKVIHVENKK